MEPLTKEQYEIILIWLNNWGHIKGTGVPKRFEYNFNPKNGTFYDEK